MLRLLEMYILTTISMQTEHHITILALPDLLDTQAVLAQQALLAQQVQRDPLAQLAQLVLLGPLALRAHLVAKHSLIHTAAILL